MTPELVVAGLGVLFGGGTIAAFAQAWVSHRKGIREADITEEQNALQGYKDLAAAYKSDLAELKREIEKKDAETDARLERIEAELSQERSTRWAAVQYARELVALILRLLPGTALPEPPDSLADHIIIPSRKDSS